MQLTDRGLGLAYGHAGACAQEALAGRVDSSTRLQMLRAPALSEALIRTVLRGGELQECAVLAARADLPPAALEKLVGDRRKGVMLTVLQRSDLQPSHLEKLVSRDDPEVNAGVFSHPRVTPELRAVIASQRPQRRTKDESAIPLAHEVRQALRDPANISLALLADDRDVLTGVLHHLDSTSFAQQLELCEKLVVRSAVRALVRVAREGKLHPRIRQVLVELEPAHPQDHAGLRAAASEVLAQLRASGECEVEVSLDPVEVAQTPGGELSVLAGSSPLDWSAIGALVLEDSCTDAAWAVLAERADFDEELLCTLARTDLQRAAQVQRCSPRAVLAALEAPITLGRWGGASIGMLLRTQQRLGGVDALEVVGHGRPAAAAVESLWRLDRGWWEEQAPLVGAMLREGLGEEPGVWMSFHELFGEFDGSLRELVATCTALHAE